MGVIATILGAKRDQIPRQRVLCYTSGDTNPPVMTTPPNLCPAWAQITTSMDSLSFPYFSIMSVSEFPSVKYNYGEWCWKKKGLF